VPAAVGRRMTDELSVPDYLEVDPLAPWPTLAERESGLLLPPEFYEGIPGRMDSPLRTCQQGTPTSVEFAQQVADGSSM
jgi:hypothetical protein